MADAVVIRHLERLLSPRLVEDFRRGVVPDKAAATHDTLERLPEVLRQPQLASFAALSRVAAALSGTTPLRKSSTSRGERRRSRCRMTTASAIALARQRCDGVHARAPR